MAFHIIILYIALAYSLWLFSLYMKMPIISLFATFLLFPLAIYIFINGIDVIPHNSLIAMMLGGVTFGIASYTALQVTLSIIDDNFR